MIPICGPRRCFPWTRAAALALALTLGAPGTARADTVELVSQASPAPDTFGNSGSPAFSADGRWVVFRSSAPNLVPGQVDDNQVSDLFLHDRATGTTTLVTHSAGSPNQASPVAGVALSLDVSMSADGRYVAFESLATDLVAGVEDTNGKGDVFLWDRVTGTTTLVSHASGAPDVPADGISYRARISADGGYVVFFSQARNLVAGQNEPASPETSDVFVWERASGAMILASRKAGLATTPANGRSQAVAFSSRATDLGEGEIDPYGFDDLFVYSRASAEVALLSRADPETPAAVAGGGDSPVISANGRFIVFRSFATDLVPGQIDTNDRNDVFLYNRVANTTALASHTGSSATTAGNEESGLPELALPLLSLDASGRFLVFSSRATDLVAGMTDENNASDVFLYDRVSGALTLISHKEGATGETGSRSAGHPQISTDGRRIAFVSAATDLAPGHPANAQASLFLQDRTTGSRIRISPVRSSSNPSANGASLTPSLSDNGRFVAFTSDVPLVAGDFNAEWDVFVYNDGPDGPVTLPPCTLFDSRRPADGPAQRSGVRKPLAVRGACGVPSTATAVVVEVTVLQPRRRGSLRLTPGNSVLRFQRGPTRTGSFTVPLAADGTLALQPTVAGNGTVHVVPEAVGYP